MNKILACFVASVAVCGLVNVPYARLGHGLKTATSHVVKSAIRNMVAELTPERISGAVSIAMVSRSVVR